MAEARAVNFAHKEIISKYCQRDEKSPPKGVWLGSRDAFLHAQLWTCKNFTTACH